MIIDNLYNRVNDKGIVCVGLDSRLEYIPLAFKEKYGSPGEIIFQYNKTIIDSTHDIVAVYKPHSAFYEAYGIDGVLAYSRTLKYIKSIGAMSIGDIKIGDISSTAEMYGKAHFEGDFEADFITLNPYMGYDSITPYLRYLESGKKGIFVLLRTSNPGAKDIEYLESGDKRVYHHIGDKLAELASNYLGNNGYSSLGFVVGGTHTDEAVEIRKRYPSIFFLIPGYGAQGATGDDVRLYLSNTNGGVVNSSRGIITAYQKYEDGPERFSYHTRNAVLNMKKDIMR